MSVYGVLADIVVFVHFLWILFLIFGAFFGVRHRAVKFIHTGGLALAVFIQIFDWYCPLTHVEVWLRMRHDPSQSYSGSFIIHYLESIVYLEVSRMTVFILTLVLIIFNVWMYGKKGNSKSGAGDR
jgi:hypothetical protein